MKMKPLPILSLAALLALSGCAQMDQQRQAAEEGAPGSVAEQPSGETPVGYEKPGMDNLRPEVKELHSLSNAQNDLEKSITSLQFAGAEKDAGRFQSSAKTAYGDLHKTLEHLAQAASYQPGAEAGGLTTPMTEAKGKVPANIQQKLDQLNTLRDQDITTPAQFTQRWQLVSDILTATKAQLGPEAASVSGIDQLTAQAKSVTSPQQMMVREPEIFNQAATVTSNLANAVEKKWLAQTQPASSATAPATEPTQTR